MFKSLFQTAEERGLNHERHCEELRNAALHYYTLKKRGVGADGMSGLTNFCHLIEMEKGLPEEEAKKIVETARVDVEAKGMTCRCHR